MNRFIVILIIAATGFSSAIAATASSSIFAGLTYKKTPDGPPQSDTTTVVKIAIELDRPCDKKEYVSWKTTNPSSDLIVLFAGLILELDQIYSFDNLSAKSPVAQKSHITVYAANPKSGNGHLTLAWTTSEALVSLAVCGDLASVAAKQPAANSSDGIKYSPPPLPPAPDPRWTLRPVRSP